MAIVTATLVVGFNATSDATDGNQLSLEIDSRDDGLNQGRTSFAPGDPVHILAFYSSNVTIIRALSTAGSLVAVSGGGAYNVGNATDFNEKEYLSFDAPDNLTASLPKPFLTGLSYDWVGNSGGAVQVVNNGTGLQMSSEDENFIGLLDVRYQARYQAYRLNGVNLNYRSVLIKLWGEY